MGTSYCLCDKSINQCRHLERVVQQNDRHIEHIFNQVLWLAWFLVHVAGTLCPLTFVYHLYLYLASVLFLNHISFLTPFLFCSLAHSAAPMRLSMNWRVINCKHNNNNNNRRPEIGFL